MALDQTTVSHHDSSRKRYGLLFAVIGSWIVTYLFAAAYPADFTAMSARFVLWCLACLIVVVLAWSVVSLRRSPWPVLFVAAIFCAFWFAGWQVAIRVRFEFLRAGLMRDVERVSEGSAPVYWTRPNGVQAEGSPSRIVFVDGGLLDNWCGFVYAPTGSELESATGVHPIPSAVRQWFGGDMIHIRRLGGGWFYCTFT